MHILILVVGGSAVLVILGLAVAVFANPPAGAPPGAGPATGPAGQPRQDHPSP